MGADTVFFLSDYGRADEFVGVVHAVLRRLAPQAAVVDLSHDIAPFDVRAGAFLLARAVAHLGPGVVLAVVDPGVGAGRRGLVLEVGPAGGGARSAGRSEGPRWFVGPDNGLLLPAAARLGTVTRAVALGDGAAGAGNGAALPPSVTFDGRDVFAPAVAALCAGVDPAELGDPVEPTALARVPEPVVEWGTAADGRRTVRCEVTWVDRFGNVQLSLPGVEIASASSLFVVGPAADGPGSEPADAVAVPVVRTFADLEAGEAGLLVDASHQVALVVREGSAAERFWVVQGVLVELIW